MKAENHYTILGVRMDADDVVIAAAFRALAKKHHPDTAAPKNPDSTSKFRRIQEAYDVLRDPEKKRAYDAKLNAQRASKKGKDETKKDGSDQRERKSSKFEASYSPNFNFKISRYAAVLTGLSILGCILLLTFYLGHLHETNPGKLFVVQPKQNGEGSFSNVVSPVSDDKQMPKSKLLDSRIPVEASEKSQTPQQIVTDFYGREVPFVNRSGKEDLGIDFLGQSSATLSSEVKRNTVDGAAQISALTSCKVSYDRIEGDHVVPGGPMTAENTLCLDTLHYDDSAKSRSDADSSKSDM